MCMCVCVYVCVHIYIYIYLYIINPHEQDVTLAQFFYVVFNRFEFRFSFSYSGCLIKVKEPIFAHSWRENNCIPVFPKGIRHR